MLGAALAAEIIPTFGWQAIFVVGGLLPLLAAVPLYWVLPESPRFLATQPGRASELARILNRVAGDGRFDGSESFVLSVQAPTQQHVAAGAIGIFSPSIRRDTFTLWIIFITNLFAVYCFYNWAPVVLTSIGMDLSTAVRGSLVFNTAGVIGSLSVSWIIARTGSRWPQAILGGVGALAMLYVGHLVSSIGTNAESNSVSLPMVALMSGLAIGGYCILAVQVTSYAVAANVYPTVCRSAGVGWAQGMGRLGGVLSAFLGAAIMARAGASGFCRAPR